MSCMCVSVSSGSSPSLRSFSCSSRWSIYMMPLRWSISCSNACASSSSAVTLHFDPAWSSARAVTCTDRFTRPSYPGTERHPSVISLCPLVRMISGFTSQYGSCSGRLSAIMRLRAPTWLAANPTPSASKSVSTMSVASLRTSSSMRLIVLHFRRRMGSGYMRIFRIDMMLDVTRAIKVRFYKLVCCARNC